ncbi:hypothetical protein A4H97_18300 [Niastella yeongjuensis]|uniref:Uncharacterized protein n=1 Tax=Niastella yeongjuensis TaxID=354355 RepID=A0A1V9DXV4_9BACT|nr:hypothetical protein [Niastella yeongjuensis]OQP38670.1 hypothetical protein A4H97_18300 [Niastella yeongjuensis]SEO37068.1 hypothetical protein SAMN05660816_02743 [Niastella yeongjuensis]
MKIVSTILIFLIGVCAYAQSDVKFIAFEHTGEMDHAMTTVILSNKDFKVVKNHKFLKYKDPTLFYKIDNGLFAALIDKLSNDKNVKITYEEELGVFMTTVEQKGKIAYYTNYTFDDAKKTIAGIIAFLKSRKDTGVFIEKLERMGKEMEVRSK